MFKRNVKLFLISLLILDYVRGYQIPKPTVQAFKGRGLRIFIPDEPGIRYFVINGNINRPIHHNGVGEIYGEVFTSINENWVYENTNIQLHVNDVINFWVFVQHYQLGYRLDDQSVVIKKLIDTTGGRVTTTTTTKAPTRQPSVRPSPTPAPVKCEKSITTVKGQLVCKNQLIFEENFDVSNSAKWKTEIKIPLDSEDAEFVSYQNSKDFLFVKNNVLWIAPKLQTNFPGFDDDRMRSGELNLNPKCTGTISPTYECFRKAQRTAIIPPVVSAKITTKESFSFKYGKIEIRAKFPKGDWLFPQLYLEPLERAYGINNFASGQMRVGFIRGNLVLDSKDNSQIDGNRLTGGIVLSTSFKLRDIWMKGILYDTHFGDDFHVYSLTWSKSSISVSVDGMVYATYRANFKTQALLQNITHANSWDSENGISPFDKEYYISLGVGVGGMGDFPDLCRTGDSRHLKPWSNTSPKAEYNFYMDRNNWYPTWDGLNSALQVDYVKVWAL